VVIRFYWILHENKVNELAMLVLAATFKSLWDKASAIGSEKHIAMDLAAGTGAYLLFFFVMSFMCCRIKLCAIVLTQEEEVQEGPLELITHITRLLRFVFPYNVRRDQAVQSSSYIKTSLRKQLSRTRQARGKAESFSPIFKLEFFAT
jgi:hypothetical protein